MYKTKNDIPEATRVKVVELLNARLADCIDLQTQTKQAHWNVKGPMFIALHGRGAIASNGNIGVGLCASHA